MSRRHLLRELVVLGVLGLLASSCTWGDGTITDITWSQARGGQFLQGRYVDGAVHVEAGPKGGTFSLITFAFSSSVDPTSYLDGLAVLGNVRYQDVEGRAYLEMTTFLQGHEVSVTRTLGDTGADAALTGSSDWREFRLTYSPSSVNSFATVTLTMRISVVLPGRGSVDVGPLRVGSITMGPRGWWGARDDFRGGIGVGAIFAILAALITWLTARGRAANAVQRSLGVVIVVGVIALAVALLASLRHQPLVVVVPLAVAGAVFAGSGLLVRGPISRRYTAIELRKIRAMDAGAGASASPPLPTGRTAAGT